ncbi:hypothetical protein EIP86_006170 [Pleurotus ostreatoroseus]|nr:hypothetical protein EIP86_006170 [Pleurotus ostreatoroseus]
MSSTHGSAEAGRAVHGPSWRTQRLALLTLSFQTLGIIYSDLGTSPLYTLNGIWPASGPVPPKEDVIGGISTVIWALTLLPLVKYVFICLHFGTTEGEGGTFALFQGLYPPQKLITDDDSLLEHEKEKDKDDAETASDSDVDNVSSRSTISPKFKIPLFVWCIFGTSLTLADGIFTPAVSVTSAVQGIAVAKPSVANDVIGISCALLVVLFLAQNRGTSQLGFLFAPVTFIWLLFLFGTGIANVTTYPGIFRAFDPSRAVMLFVRTKDYDLLAGVLLALTGCEAMFASLGHFNILSIQLSFSFIVYPSIVLAYLGQGARLIVDGEAALQNMFYATIPGSHNGPLYWIIFVLGILSTVSRTSPSDYLMDILTCPTQFIASQTLITAAFSLVQQLIKMHVLPPLRVIHTSETINGQIYIPAVNWLLMIVTIIVVATFKDPAKLTNAYGFSVATVMFTTSVLIAIQMKYVKHWHVLIAVGFFLTFGFFDALFWGAALTKVPEGAWVSLMIGAILMIIMVFWSWAKGLEDTFDGANRKDVHRLIFRKNNELLVGEQTLTEVQYEEAEMREKEKYFIRDATEGSPSHAYFPHVDIPMVELSRLPTCAVFHRLTAGKGIPHSFAGFIRQWPALPRVVILLSVNVLSIARVSPEDRYSVRKVPSVNGFYLATYRLGYRDKFDTRINFIVEQICSLEARDNPDGCAATIEEIREELTQTYTVSLTTLSQAETSGLERSTGRCLGAGDS